MPPDADAPTSHGLAPGSEIPGYRILRVIGAGGFGVTYLAEHAVIGNRAAIKEFLPAGIAARTPDGRTVGPISESARGDFAWGLDSFRREARMLGALDHPNIVRVLNFVEANGTAYMIMEHVEGEGLEQRLRRQPVLPPEDVAALVPGLLAGLEAVHAAGMLHRDIKPENVIVRPGGQPVLIDFGAARQAFGTRNMTAVLSEGYAPYEQYDEQGNQGPWTDIYALGGLLYRCITGERPATGLRRIEAKVKGKGDPLVPAAERARGRYPPKLLAAIDAALAPLEADRPQDVAAMRALLDGVVDWSLAAPPKPRPIPAENEGNKPDPLTSISGLRADGTLIAATVPPKRRAPRVALIALLLLGGGAAYYYMAETRREEAAAEARRRAEAAAAEAAAAESKRVAEARRIAEEEESKRRVEAEARRQAEEAAIREANAALDAGAAAVGRRDYDPAIEQITRAIDSGKLARDRLAFAHHVRAKAWREKKNNGRALADLDKALALDPKIAGSWEDRALIKAERFDYDGALADIDEAVRLKPGEPNFHTTRGYVLGLKRDLDGSIEAFTESLRLRPDHAYTLYNRGVAWWNKGDAVKAIADYRAALKADPNFTIARQALRDLGQTP